MNRLARAAKEIADAVEKIDESEMAAAATAVAKAKCAFVGGAGRSGLAARMFAMRLAQAGMAVHVVGDATATAAGKGDVLFLVSGSGTTPGVLGWVKRARGAGCGVWLLTHSPDSPLAREASGVVTIPLPKDAAGGIAGEGWLVSVFEECAVVVLDVLAERVAAIRGETPETLRRRHANLE